MRTNPLLAIDFYKADHISQYPEGTTKVYSNFTPRSNKRFKGSKSYDGKVVVHGIQKFLKSYLIEDFNELFFNKPKEEVVGKYKRFMDNTLGEDAIDVKHIEALHDLGYLPLEIRAIPEGSRIPCKIPVLTITNTEPEFFWLPNYIETVLSTELWKPITNATIAYEYKRTFIKYAELTGASLEFVPFQGHDFSARGLANKEDAYNSGTGHLLSFVGTDTCLAIEAAEDYLNANIEEELVGTSIKAYEHSSATSSILNISKRENCDLGHAEYLNLKDVITRIYPSGFVSYVADSFDFWRVISEIALKLKPEILARDGKLVFRPDSGNPVDIICGFKYIERDEVESIFHSNIYYDITKGYCTKDVNGNIRQITDIYEYSEGGLRSFELGDRVLSEAEVKGAVQVLWETFGGTTNEKGFKELDSHVGLIYGDSITLERQEEILRKLMEKGFASSNIVLGIGSYTYQFSTRDTLGLAMKATYIEVEDGPLEIYKDPATDDGTKKSAKGLLRVDLVDDEYILREQVALEEAQGGELKRVFIDSMLENETSLKEIRARLS